MTSKNTDPWASPDDDDETTFADLFDPDERRTWARRRMCKHCFVWHQDDRTGDFLIACAHGCGTVRHRWSSPDADGDYRRMKATQEAFAIAHAYGCPRDRERGRGPWTRK